MTTVYITIQEKEKRPCFYPSISTTRLHIDNEEGNRILFKHLTGSTKKVSVDYLEDFEFLADAHGWIVKGLLECYL